MPEPLHLHGIPHQIGCRLLKQLETNCYEIPPRDIWWKQEVARDLQAEVCLFLCQSLGNSTFQPWNGAEVAAGLPDQPAADGCTPWHPLCALSGIIGCCFACLSHRNDTSGFLTPLSPTAWIPQLLSHSSLSSSSQFPSLETECHFHGKWILSAGVQDTSLASVTQSFPVLPWAWAELASPLALCCEAGMNTGGTSQCPSPCQGGYCRFFPPPTLPADPHLCTKEFLVPLQVLSQFLISIMCPAALGQSILSLLCDCDQKLCNYN